MKNEISLEQKSFISKKAEIGENVVFCGVCIVEDGAIIQGNSYIENSVIHGGAKIFSSYVISSEIGEKTTVGPFAHVRMNSKIGNSCRIGNFVEIKNSSLDEGTKCAHLTYVGDATIGKRVNMGCGVVFANYDGKTKHHSTIGNDVFIGCNCNIVAPRTVGDNCFIGAGTTLTNDLPKNSFAIGRVRDTFKEKSP